jgi:hypothetical protein
LLDKVVPALGHPDPDVCLYAAEALVNLSVSAKNQEVNLIACCRGPCRLALTLTLIGSTVVPPRKTITKANALPLVVQALKSDDEHFQLQSLLLLYNLSQCGTRATWRLALITICAWHSQ